ncbi:MAG: hypothetical protein WAV46_01495 [Candidatus Moraniibacteriota bacterium]
MTPLTVESKENDPAIAPLSSSWKNPEYPRLPDSIQHLFSGLPDSQIEKLFKVMQVLADRAGKEISTLDTKSRQDELRRYPHGLWFNLPFHAFPESISREDIMNALGMFHEYFGILKSVTYYGDYELAIKFNSEAADFLFLKHLVDARMDMIPKTKTSTQEKELKSLSLVAETLQPNDVIFLVYDGRYESPIRFEVKNAKGEDTYIKKLHSIAYIVNAPGTRVDFDKNLQDCINNGLFKRSRLKEYMKTNGLRKPTLIQKSKQENILVLKNEIPVKVELVKNIPSQYRSLYIDKTI